LQSQAS